MQNNVDNVCDGSIGKGTSTSIGAYPNLCNFNGPSSLNSDHTLSFNDGNLDHIPLTDPKKLDFFNSYRMFSKNLNDLWFTTALTNPNTIDNPLNKLNFNPSTLPMLSFLLKNTKSYKKLDSPVPNMPVNHFPETFCYFLTFFYFINKLLYERCTKPYSPTKITDTKKVVGAVETSYFGGNRQYPGSLPFSSVGHFYVNLCNERAVVPDKFFRVDFDLHNMIAAPLYYNSSNMDTLIINRSTDLRLFFFMLISIHDLVDIGLEQVLLPYLTPDLVNLDLILYRAFDSKSGPCISVRIPDFDTPESVFYDLPFDMVVAHILCVPGYANMVNIAIGNMFFPGVVDQINCALQFAASHFIGDCSKYTAYNNHLLHSVRMSKTTNFVQHAMFNSSIVAYNHPIRRPTRYFNLTDDLLHSDYAFAPAEFYLQFFHYMVQCDMAKVTRKPIYLFKTDDSDMLSASEVSDMFLAFSYYLNQGDFRESFVLSDDQKYLTRDPKMVKCFLDPVTPLYVKLYSAESSILLEEITVGDKDYSQYKNSVFDLRNYNKFELLSIMRKLLNYCAESWDDIFTAQLPLRFDMNYISQFSSDPPTASKFIPDPRYDGYFEVKKVYYHLHFESTEHMLAALNVYPQLAYIINLSVGKVYFDPSTAIKFAYRLLLVKFVLKRSSFFDDLITLKDLNHNAVILGPVSQMTLIEKVMNGEHALLLPAPDGYTLVKISLKENLKVLEKYFSVQMLDYLMFDQKS